MESEKQFPAPEPPNQPPPYGYPQSYPPQYAAQSYLPQGYPGPPSAQTYPAQNYQPSQPYGPGQQQRPTIGVPPEGCFRRNQKNKPQSNAVGAAALIFISGGMNIALSAGFHNSYLTIHMRVCWFIGAIIGALFSCFLANQISKKIIFQFSSFLVLIGGIVLACTKHNQNAMTAGLYLDGIANGFVFAPTLALAGEVVVFYMRGSITTNVEQMCYGIGFFLQIIYSMSWNSGAAITSEQLHGLLSTVYGIIGLIIGSFLTIESPVLVLATKNEEAALDTLRLLQEPFTITSETYEQLAEHKRYLEKNKVLSTCESLVQAIPAFIRLVFLRALNAMSMSQVAGYAFTLATYTVYRNQAGPYVVFGLCRWLGNFITAFCTDTVGRKKLVLLGLLVTASMAIGAASKLDSSYKSWKFPKYNPHDMESVMALLCVYQVFAGVAFTPTSAYLSEAYPLGVKQNMISFTFIAEMLVFLIINATDLSFTGTVNFFYILGGISAFSFVVGIWTFPETKRTTLRESQDKFRGMLSKGC
ncbi:hexose transporter HXT8-like [Scaptodrosophila lebanonensis]|uniref:Hexose transporter HXT8-like n=1 Tax=Drosophila lebanonensis TaxID=7225 RepID=A0A6J2TAD5_DROLE|nr:hexose transporter HXT8-like [Scaptodrosophila lebanonensis]